jgi:hypothetical protein
MAGNEWLQYIDTEEHMEGSTNESLLADVLKSREINDVCQILSVCSGTVRRWQELKSVPSNYRIDLLKMMDVPVPYETFSSKEKDQFFTPPELAKQCWDMFRTHVPDISGYTFIEPSAGDGAFLPHLPPGSLAFDIEPRHPAIDKRDYLDWTPSEPAKYIVFGNPPFGLRGHLALRFLNHSASFADYVCFLLPQLFESDGKGAPRKRVVGLSLIHSEKIHAVFRTPEQTDVSVNCVFQIWSKHETNARYTIQVPDEEELKVYSLSDGGTVSTTRNKNMLTACDIYLPSTCFGREAMKVYESFEDLPGRKGYGLVFRRNRDTHILKAKSIKWDEVSFLSTNSAFNLRTSLIHSQFSGTS